VLVFVAGVTAIIFVIVLAFGGGDGIVNPDRSSPQSVHDRTVEALKSKDLQAMYDELSPNIKGLIPPEHLTSTQTLTQGVVDVELLSAPQIKSEDPWNGEWADASVRIRRDEMIEDYLVRYHFENGGWWLYATLKIN
jgi:hypothetical protein